MTTKSIFKIIILTLTLTIAFALLSCGQATVTPTESGSLSYPKVEAGKAGSAFPATKPDGTVTYSLAPLKAAVTNTLIPPNIDTNTGEVTVTATTTAGTYQVTAMVAGGDTYTAPFYVTIFASNKQNISDEIEGTNTGIAMWGNDGDYNYLDTSAVMDMSYLFAPEYSLEGVYLVNQRSSLNGFNGDISLWDVSQVTNMESIFYFASSFTGDLSLWDVSKVRDMDSMFFNATAFNADISGWTVDNVTDMYAMFSLANNFNQNLNNWNVSKVTHMGSMFNRATAFNQNLNTWDVGNVTIMYDMFSNATAFNGDIRSWDVGKVTSMNRMFQNATNLNRDISGWAVDRVTDMDNMFEGATAFTQDLEPWGDHLKGRTVSMTNMFTNSGVTTTPSWYTQ